MFRISEAQQANYQFFLDELPKLLADPIKKGKIAVVHDLQIKGLFDTIDAGYRFAVTNLCDDFIIQEIVNEDEVVSFLSPVVPA